MHSEKEIKREYQVFFKKKLAQYVNNRYGFFIKLYICRQSSHKNIEQVFEFVKLENEVNVKTYNYAFILDLILIGVNLHERVKNKSFFLNKAYILIGDLIFTTIFDIFHKENYPKELFKYSNKFINVTYSKLITYTFKNVESIDDYKEYAYLKRGMISEISFIFGYFSIHEKGYNDYDKQIFQNIGLMECLLEDLQSLLIRRSLEKNNFFSVLIRKQGLSICEKIKLNRVEHNCIINDIIKYKINYIYENILKSTQDHTLELLNKSGYNTEFQKKYVLRVFDLCHDLVGNLIDDFDTEIYKSYN